MSGILFDTSVYISALRQGDETILSLRRAARAHDHKTRPLWLSAVVLHELYLGAEGARARKELQRLEREFVKVDRLLIPSRIDWTTAGFALSKIGRKYGFELVGWLMTAKSDDSSSDNIGAWRRARSAATWSTNSSSSAGLNRSTACTNCLPEAD